MADRTVLVTGGGGRGGGPGTVGWAISRLMAEQGARVAVVDRDPAAAARTVDAVAQAGGEAVAVIADLSSEQERGRAISESAAALGSLDTLINNVAQWSPEELFDVGPERFGELLDANLVTAWSMCRHAREVLSEGGAVVNVSSVAAGRPGTVYGLGKAGVEAMTRGAAFLLAERGIRVNSVRLGPLWTAAVAANLPEEAREPRRRMVALQSEGDCWDAAWAVLFLASSRARWISGEVLAVDGGGPPRQPYPGVSRPAPGGGS